MVVWKSLIVCDSFVQCNVERRQNPLQSLSNIAEPQLALRVRGFIHSSRFQHWLCGEGVRHPC